MVCLITPRIVGDVVDVPKFQRIDELE